MLCDAETGERCFCLRKALEMYAVYTERFGGGDVGQSVVDEDTFIRI